MARSTYLPKAGFYALAAFFSAEASAQNANNQFGSSYYNQTYQHGLALPHVPLPSGSDEFRAADGTACCSNTASNDAYLDVGAIGSQDVEGSSIGGTFYGRIIMPLGPKPKRLDCTHLYTLEIERLRHELQLVRMGAGGKHVPSSADVAEVPVAAPSGGKAKKATWQTEGWSTPGRGKPGGQAAAGDQGAIDRTTVVPPRKSSAQKLGGPTPSQHVSSHPVSSLAGFDEIQLAAARARRAGVVSQPAAEVGSGWVTIVDRSR